MALLLIGITPFVYSIPNILMVRELQSMMPVEGSYYHWTKQGFNPFTGFMTGWMNWVMSWVDVAIYPVLGATYLGFFVPAAQRRRGGHPRLGAAVAGRRIVIIWAISLPADPGSASGRADQHLAGRHPDDPAIIMTVLGFYNWGVHGSSFHMTFLPKDTGMSRRLQPGLWVVMWNYMGWELPTSAGDEIVKPKRTYPLAMAAGADRRDSHLRHPDRRRAVRGRGRGQQGACSGVVEESTQGAGIGPVLEDGGHDAQSRWSSRRGPDQQSKAGGSPTSPRRWPKTAAHRAAGSRSFLGNFMMVAAILSMIGLFIGNSVSATRIPFALSEDGMMPKPLGAGPSQVRARRGSPSSSAA